jgi:hypothetical protein
VGRLAHSMGDSLWSWWFVFKTNCNNMDCELSMGLCYFLELFDHIIWTTSRLLKLQTWDLSIEIDGGRMATTTMLVKLLVLDDCLFDYGVNLYPLNSLGFFFSKLSMYGDWKTCVIFSYSKWMFILFLKSLGVVMHNVINPLLLLFFVWNFILIWGELHLVYFVQWTLAI